LISASSAFAQNTFRYEAEVTSVFGPHSRTFSSGDKVNISYTLNPAVADTNADLKQGFFTGAGTGMSVSFPGLGMSATAGAAGNAQTFDDIGATSLTNQVFFFGGPIAPQVRWAGHSGSSRRALSLRGRFTSAGILTSATNSLPCSARRAL
jgi:hypothetical protein